MDKKFQNILILSDFDGTFAGKNGRILEKNLKSIEYFKKNGGHFSFSTGRLPSVLAQIYPDFLKTANAPAIMSNGAIIYDVQKEIVLRETFFDGSRGRDVAADILSVFPEFSLSVYSEDGVMQEDVSPDEAVGEMWRKMRFHCYDTEKIISCRDYVNNKYGGEFNCFRSWHTIFEMVGKNSDKGLGVKFIRDYYIKKGFSDIKVFCIGDFENDIDMLKIADVAFCPENAVSEVKRISRHILCNHDDGAVFEMISTIEEKYI
ncbi:MAG: HAD-IIB family hydrolase [Clostridia bacterium]|nr:HAD-IIB family hydrolase [Clostridia bacterium]